MRTGATGHVSTSIRPGDLLAGRYRLEDLLNESRGGRFWRAHDRVLDRHVAVHCLAADDERAPQLLDAARRSAAVLDRSILRVLDADERDDVVYVVNEWGEGASLDIALLNDGPLEPRHAAWIAAEVGASIAAAHDAGVAHGRLNPENVLLDLNGHMRLIGLGVEAALWGLPQGRKGIDVVDLVAVLYAGLTGRWAGVSQTAVPRAPTEHGDALRPRQVRAGIPRPLDALCDQVLNPGGIGAHARTAYDLTTARGITDSLRAFVGEGGDLPPATARLVRRVRRQGPSATAEPAGPTDGTELASERTAEQPAVDEEATTTLPVAATAPEPAPGAPAQTTHLPSAPAPPADSPAPTSAAESPAPTSAADQPTELGMPIFDDDSGDVHWLTARATKPPPPPPFEEHPARPLFAPDPAPGEPARRPRPGAPTPSGEYWPWESSTGTGAPVTTGSGPLVDDEPIDDGVPGRSWLRLGMVILATLLAVLAVLVAVNLFRGRAPLSLGTGSDGDPSPSTGSSSAAAQPVAGLTADDLDPQGEPPEENPELATLAVDGDPDTDWHTSTYTQQLGPGGLKSGVGLVVDVGEILPLQTVSVDLLDGPSTVSVFVTEERPDFVKDLRPVASETVEGRLQATLDGATGRYVVLWFTSLPAVDGGFRGSVAEVEVTS